MSKYYVTTGAHMVVLIADTPRKAALRLLSLLGRNCGGSEPAVGPTFRLSERGFEEHSDDVVLDSKIIVIDYLSNPPEGGD